MKKCKPFKKRLTAYMYGELNDAEQAYVAEHLEACVHCRAELKELRGTLDLLGEALDTASAPEALNPWRSLRRPVYVPKNRFEKIWYSPQFKSVLAASALASIFLLISGSIIVFRYLPEQNNPTRVAVEFEPEQTDRPRVAVDRHSVPDMNSTLRRIVSIPAPDPAVEDVPVLSPEEMASALSFSDEDSAAGFSAPDYVYGEYSKPGARATYSEPYDWLPENSFQMAINNPLSTFAVDVGRASYANVRRFLNNNLLPPVEIVRVDEMINYFDYGYPQPEGDDAFAIAIEVGRCPWNEGHELVLVGLQGANAAKEDLAPGPAPSIARDVRIQVEFNPAQIKAYRLIGYEDRMKTGANTDIDRKGSGDLGAGHSVTALYELIPAGSDEEIPEQEALEYQKTHLVESDDLMTIKLRYKRPADDVSRLLVRSVAAIDYGENSSSERFRLASEVAEFGLLLRNSEFKANADYGRLIRHAQAARQGSEDGRLAEFVRLVEKARQLDRSIEQ